MPKFDHNLPGAKLTFVDGQTPVPSNWLEAQVPHLGSLDYADQELEEGSLFWLDEGWAPSEEVGTVQASAETDDAGNAGAVRYMLCDGRHILVSEDTTLYVYDRDLNLLSSNTYADADSYVVPWSNGDTGGVAYRSVATPTQTHLLGFADFSTQDTEDLYTETVGARPVHVQATRQYLLIVSEAMGAIWRRGIPGQKVSAYAAWALGGSYKPRGRFATDGTVAFVPIDDGSTYTFARILVESMNQENPVLTRNAPASTLAVDLALGDRSLFVRHFDGQQMLARMDLLGRDSVGAWDWAVGGALADLCDRALLTVDGAAGVVHVHDTQELGELLNTGANPIAGAGYASGYSAEDACTDGVWLYHAGFRGAAGANIYKVRLNLPPRLWRKLLAGEWTGQGRPLIPLG